MIDQAIGEIFQSQARSLLCSTYQSALNLTYALGVSPNKASEIMQNCTFFKGLTGAVPKNLSKKYFLILDADKKSQVQSWTTLSNKTYIWVDSGLNIDLLKKVLAHEIAISLDAKFNMTWSNYVVFQNYLEGKDKDPVVYIYVDQMTKVENKLMKAFQSANQPSIALSFATMRALAFEKYIEGRPFSAVEDHKLCAEKFRRLYAFFSEHPSDFNQISVSAEDTLLNLIANMHNDIYPSVNSDFEWLLDSSFMMTRTKETFCQYMARPALSTKAQYSLFANGPRPRVIGGWDKISPNQEQIQNPLIDQEADMKNPKGDLLIKKLEQDLLDQKVFKIKNESIKQIGR